MRLSRKRFLGMFLLVVFFLSFFILEFNFAQQVRQEEQEEKIIPSPQNIKESTGIYVFVAWMWIAIFVLIYILRLKIREVDRLLQIRFLSAKKK
jgi:ABC-type Fe3+ transport system permease subunit